MLPNIEIIKVLSEAYSPCQSFGKCKEAQWLPEEGHIPRGFLGATGSVDEVEAIFVFAEPGHPMVDKNDTVLEPYPESSDPEGYMELTTDFAFKCFDREVDVMHSNVKYILNQVWPSLQFAEQLKKVWMTETRLCSIDDEIGNIPIGNRDICSRNYLKKQLNIFPEATVVGFGGKAQQTLRRLNVKHLKAWSVSPPGANNSKARDSWDQVIEVLNRKDY